MAQVGVDFKPYGYGSSTLTTLKNIRVEGIIPGITNLKPRTGGSNEILAVQVDESKLGYLGDVLLENIWVEGLKSKGRIMGMANATLTGSKTFYVQNVEFKDVVVGNDTINNVNFSKYMTIETATTQDIRFSNKGTEPAKKDSFRIEAEDFFSYRGGRVTACEDIGGGQCVEKLKNDNNAFYGLTIEQEGVYAFRFRVATGGIGGNIAIFKGANELGSIQVDSALSNGWQDWYSTEPVFVDLPKGEHLLKLQYSGGADFLFNLNWFEVIYAWPSAIKPTEAISFNVYPNPSAGDVFIATEIPNGSTQILIHTLQGKLVHRMQTSGNPVLQIPYETFPTKGIYLLTLQNGGTCYTQKVAVQ